MNPTHDPELAKGGASDAAGERQRKAVERIQRMLARLACDPGSVDAELAAVEESFFVTDGGWREAFTDFRTRPGRATTLKILALEEYLRYLRTRPDPLAPAPPGADPADRSTDGFGTSAGVPAAHLHTYGPVIAASPPLDHERLPPHEPVRVSGSGDRIAIWLASHRFELVVSGRPALVDENGASHPLADGRHVVGRAPYNDVVLASDHADLSRQHVVVDVVDGRVHTIMDISLHGTFLPRSAVGREWG